MIDSPEHHEAPTTLLVLGGTGRTGRHFVRLALDAGHRVRVVARASSTALEPHPRLEIRHGSISDPDLALDPLLDGVDAVVSMLGDARAQRTAQVNTALVRRLIPAMRRSGANRFLYQAGALSAPPDRRLPLPLRAVRASVARAYIGQHEDNEAVMRHLAHEAPDVDWVVHRAAIGSDGPSQGLLQRSRRRSSIATFTDCAEYSLRLLFDPTAIHTSDLSGYQRSARDR